LSLDFLDFAGLHTITALEAMLFLFLQF